MRGSIVWASAAAVITAGLAAPVQAKDLADGLRGRWAADKEALFEVAAPPDYKTATPEKKKEMLASGAKSMPDMAFEFTGDTITASVGGEPQIASYKVTKVEKRTVFFDALARNAPTPEADKMYAEFVDDDTLKLSKVGDQMILVLRRQK
jgi:hypothetical protein